MPASGLFSSGRIFFKITSERTAARTDVPAKFSHMPVKPKGQKAPISSTGNTSAVDTEMRDAGRGFSMASM